MPRSNPRTLAVGLAAAWIALLFWVNPVAFALPPFKAAFLLLVTGLLLLMPTVRQALARPLGGPARWIGPLLLAYGWSALISDGHWFPSTRSFLLLVVPVVWLLATRECFWNHGETILRALLASAAVLGLIAVLQVFGIDLIYGRVSRGVAVATLGNANAFAAVAAPLWVLALVGSTEPGRWQWMAWSALATLTPALLLARSRGGWLGALIGAAVTVVTSSHEQRRALIRPAVFCLLFAGIAWLPTPEGSEANRTGFALTHGSDPVRLAVARSSGRLIADAPWFGHGPGQFRVEFPRFREEREATTETRGGAESIVDHPHNTLLRLAAEGGGIATLCLILLAGSIAWHLWRTDRTHAGDSGLHRIALLGMGAALATGAMTWSHLNDPVTAALLGLWGGMALASFLDADAATPARWWRWAVQGGVLVATLGVAVPSLLGESLQSQAVWSRMRGHDSRSLGPSEVEDLRRAARVDPFDIDRQTLIGSMFLEGAEPGSPTSRELLDDARACFDRALVVHPHEVRSLEASAEIAVRSRKPERARNLLSRAHALEPWGPPAANRLRDLQWSHQQFLNATRSAWEAQGKAALPGLLSRLEALPERHLQQSAQCFDYLSQVAGEVADVHRLGARAFRDIGDDIGYAHARRQEQWCYALESMDLGEFDTARRSLRLARRFSKDAGGPEQWIEALLLDEQGAVDAARALRNTLPEDTHLPEWLQAYSPKSRAPKDG